ncbi:MAG TPA: alpha-glucuronidase family glycosyl hydrolase [Terriglobales bacterium]|nr:alpha-glucuronidase family glycosyl hydrolase [Terriglobales bacterium]
MTLRRILSTGIVTASIVFSCLTIADAAQPSTARISLAPAQSNILVDTAEPSYVQYAANDLANYLQEIGHVAVAVRAKRGTASNKTIIAIGRAMAHQIGQDAGVSSELGDEGYVIRSFQTDGTAQIIVAGYDPHGTNAGVAALLQMIRAEKNVPFLDGPVNIRSKPSYPKRGIHLNGWPLNYPYAFRSWKEADWKRFVDIAWAQRINLFYLWPFMEILPVPLSKEDEAYLQEVQRVVNYAKNERGMEVWIMQSANRIGTSDCGTPDPRVRPYWVNECQKDMNPADPQQFSRIMTSFEAFYKIVNNADAYCMIDSDPGGWPQSPISDQVKILQGARKLLDQYSVGKSKTKLVDWMHVGWGRHKFFTSTDSVVAAYDWTDKNPDESDVAFMGETIRYFKAHMQEPWDLIAGQPPYLSVVQQEHVLGKAVYLPYGAIEHEPAFPATNLGQESVKKVFDKAKRYPGLLGVMGNNQLMLLQFPRTFYFFSTAWDAEYENRPEAEVMLDLAGQLYPEHQQLIADSFLALRETEVARINAALKGVDQLLQAGDAGHAGALGRLLIPDHLSILRNLKMQLEIRAARQTLLEAMRGKPSIAESSALVEDYLDKLLAWNKETGWNKMIEITVWPRPIYESGKDFTEAMYRLKQLLAQGAPYTSYAKVDAFFAGISKSLLEKYDQDSVMVGCVEPLKVAVLQGQ